jgi:hypothetical protein
MPRLFALKAQSERIGTLAVFASGAWLSRWNLIAQEKRNGRIRKRKERRIAVNIAKLPELLGKALKLWRNDPTAYPFDSNNVVAITEFYSNRVMLGFALISIVITLMAVAVRF